MKKKLFEAIDDDELNYRDIYNSISIATNSFKKESGEFKYKSKVEANLAKGILEEKYLDVFIKPLDSGEEYDLFYSVNYSGPTSDEDESNDIEVEENYKDFEFQDDKNPEGTPIGRPNGFRGSFKEKYNERLNEMSEVNKVLNEKVVENPVLSLKEDRKSDIESTLLDGEPSFADYMVDKYGIDIYDDEISENPDVEDYYLSDYENYLNHLYDLPKDSYGYYHNEDEFGTNKGTIEKDFEELDDEVDPEEFLYNFGLNRDLTDDEAQAIINKTFDDDLNNDLLLPDQAEEGKKEVFDYWKTLQNKLPEDLETDHLFEGLDDEILYFTCPVCGEDLEYIGAQGNYEEYKCPDCEEYYYATESGDLLPGDEAFTEDLARIKPEDAEYLDGEIEDAQINLGTLSREAREAGAMDIAKIADDASDQFENNAKKINEGEDKVPGGRYYEPTPDEEDIERIEREATTDNYDGEEPPFESLEEGKDCEEPLEEAIAEDQWFIIKTPNGRMKDGRTTKYYISVQRNGAGTKYDQSNVPLEVTTWGAHNQRIIRVGRDQIMGIFDNKDQAIQTAQSVIDANDNFFSDL